MHTNYNWHSCHTCTNSCSPTCIHVPADSGTLSHVCLYRLLLKDTVQTMINTTTVLEVILLYVLLCSLTAWVHCSPQSPNCMLLEYCQSSNVGTTVDISMYMITCSTRHIEDVHKVHGHSVLQ